MVDAAVEMHGSYTCWKKVATTSNPVFLVVDLERLLPSQSCNVDTWIGVCCNTVLGLSAAVFWIIYISDLSALSLGADQTSLSFRVCWIEECSDLIDHCVRECLF